MEIRIFSLEVLNTHFTEKHNIAFQHLARSDNLVCVLTTTKRKEATK